MNPNGDVADPAVVAIGVDPNENPEVPLAVVVGVGSNENFEEAADVFVGVDLTLLSIAGANLKLEFAFGAGCGVLI